MPDQDHVGDLEQRQQSTSKSSPATEMSMMRVAVAGTGGLARIIAWHIDNETSHQVVLLSRTAQEQLSQIHQVIVVNYSSQQSLQFALRGIDTVISTVTGLNQVELIRAAVAARVRRFAPAEFEGIPRLRPEGDPLNRGRAEAQQWLHYYRQHIQTTNFVCGILYERFQPGGLRSPGLRMVADRNFAPGFGDEGDYIINCRDMSAQIPHLDTRNGSKVTICLTAAQDVGKFVCRAIDLPQWPAEMRMCGERMTVESLIELIQQLMGRRLQSAEYHNAASLRSALQLATVQRDGARQKRLNSLIATVEGRYDFGQPNLNVRFPAVQTLPFRTWFINKWQRQA